MSTKSDIEALLNPFADRINLDYNQDIKMDDVVPEPPKPITYKEIEVSFTNFFCLGSGIPTHEMNSKAEIISSEMDYREVTKNNNPVRNVRGFVRQEEKEELFMETENARESVKMFDPNNRINSGIIGFPFFLKDIFNEKSFSGLSEELKKKIYTQSCIMGFVKEKKSCRTRVCLALCDTITPSHLGVTLLKEMLNPLFKFRLLIKVSEDETRERFCVIHTKKKKYMEPGSKTRKDKIHINKGFIYVIHVLKIIGKTKIPRFFDPDNLSSSSSVFDSSIPVLMLSNWLSYSPYMFMVQKTRKWGSKGMLSFFLDIFVRVTISTHNFISCNPKKGIYNFAHLIPIVFSMVDLKLLTREIKLQATNLAGGVHTHNSKYDSAISSFIIQFTSYFEDIILEERESWRLAIKSLGKRFGDTDQSFKSMFSVTTIPIDFKTITSEVLDQFRDILEIDEYPDRGGDDDDNNNNDEEENGNENINSKKYRMECELSSKYMAAELDSQDRRYQCVKSTTKKWLGRHIDGRAVTLAFFHGVMDKMRTQQIKYGGYQEMEIADFHTITRDVDRPISYFKVMERCYQLLIQIPSTSSLVPNILANIYENKKNPWGWISLIMLSANSPKAEQIYQRILSCLNKVDESFYVPLFIVISSSNRLSEFITDDEVKKSNVSTKPVVSLGELIYYDIYDWMVNIPVIHKRFHKLLCNESIEFLQKYGYKEIPLPASTTAAAVGVNNIESTDKTLSIRIELNQLSKMFQLCRDTIGCIIIGLAINKYKTQHRNTNAGGLVFFNERDTHEKFMKDSSFFDSFIANSKYPIEVYKIIKLILHDCHCNMKTYFRWIQTESSFIIRSLEHSTEDYSFSDFVSCANTSCIYFIKNTSYRNIGYESMITFPTLFHRMGLEKSKDVITRDSISSTTTELSEFDKRLEEIESIVSRYMTPNKIEKKLFTLKECMLLEKNLVISNTSSVSTIPEGIPDYCIISQKTQECSHHISLFLTILFTSQIKNSSKNQQQQQSVTQSKDVHIFTKDEECSYEINEELLNLFLKQIQCQYRLLYDRLNFMFQPKINGMVDVNELEAFKSLLTKKPKKSSLSSSSSSSTHGDNSTHNKILVFTTKYGDRFTAFNRFQKEFGFVDIIGKTNYGRANNTILDNGEEINNEGKKKIMYLVDIESLVLLSNVPESTFNFPYQHIIFDCMHAWTMAECTSVFKTLSSLVTAENLKDCRIWLLSNTNTVKNYGYEIVKDMARLQSSIQEIYNNNPSMFSNSSSSSKKAPTQITKSQLRHEFYKKSKTDEIFTEESRIIQWNQHCHKFKFLQKRESVLLQEEKEIIDSITEFSQKYTCSGKRIVVIYCNGNSNPNRYDRSRNKISFKKIEQELKKQTCKDSQFMSLYHWCIVKDLINTIKIEGQKDNNSYVLKQIESCLFLNMKSVDEELQTNLVFAINRAIEMTKVNIYFDLEKEIIFTIFVTKSKDDFTKKNSILFRGGFTKYGNNSGSGYDHTTSILFEHLADAFLALCKPITKDQ